MKISFRTIVIIFLSSLLLSLGIIKLQYKNHTETQNQNSVESLNKKITMLTGKVLYQSGNNLVLYDLSSKKEVTVLQNIYSDNWVYSNGFIIAVDNDNNIIRVNTKNLQESKELLNYKDLIKDKFNQTIIWPLLRLIPSPDGTKVAIEVTEVEETYQKIEYEYLIIKDFNSRRSNIKQINLSGGNSYSTWSDESRYLWFGDSRYLYLDNRQIVDTETWITKSVTGLKDNQIYPSSSGDSYLWFDYKAWQAKDRGIFDFYRPNLMISHLGRTFPEIKDNYDQSDGVITFFQFPVVARDFKKITKVFPAEQRNQFFIEIDSGKSDLYFTDSSGTFKKITPNNSDSYYFISYNPLIKKVLARKEKQDRTYHDTYHSLQTELVLLDKGNYSEYISDIDNSNFYEKTLLRFSSPVAISNISFSPDGKYLLTPTGRKNVVQDKVIKKLTGFVVISLDDASLNKLDIEFGNKFYWIE